MQECQQRRAADILSSRPAFAAAASCKSRAALEQRRTDRNAAPSVLWETNGPCVKCEPNVLNSPQILCV